MYSISIPPDADSADLPLYSTPDTVDSLSDFKYRSECNISSLDLHVPYSPLCSSRAQMLEAMSGGGRIGFDGPYIPRGCDMRHIVGALNVFLRKDLGYGAVNFNQQEKNECFCLTQFNVKTCSVQGIFKKADVELHDPPSLLLTLFLVRYPIAPEELQRLSAALGTEKTTKPLAFVYGMGLWNNLDIHATVNFLTTVENHIIEQLPYFRPTLSGVPPFFPRLFSQGNRALMLYEESIRRIVQERKGMEVLGTWNATIQMNKYDGVHVGNLLKAMMVMNWLNLLREDI
ncbi:hypothetical protein L211DRAFT_859060 [Terfezia boudieri ATCC MYA-4762]|uniref:Uncharacterized protein n=1 Tax=Terfezia boudieri ATCC MYA-4762 TaxID=1051890 RepID=A0A3N4L998_9PEZI|nr:hypothetical protein L211DRAFT_859060 [Terfezia boudieri ATCC MYA-4762]